MWECSASNGNQQWSVTYIPLPPRQFMIEKDGVGSRGPQHQLDPGAAARCSDTLQGTPPGTLSCTAIQDQCYIHRQRTSRSTRGVAQPSSTCPSGAAWLVEVTSLTFLIALATEVVSPTCIISLATRQAWYFGHGVIGGRYGDSTFSKRCFIPYISESEAMVVPQWGREWGHVPTRPHSNDPTFALPLSPLGPHLAPLGPT